MRIHLEKFGTVLSSRPAGKDAYAGFSPTFADITADEEVEVDFSGVSAFTPSWGDEFLTPLLARVGERLVLTHTENPSVALTLELLEETNGYRFRRR